MKNNETQQGKYLTTKEYKSLIEDLVEDKDREECYNYYRQQYSDTNSNFEYKFFENVRDMGFPERNEYYVSNDIDKEEIKIIEKFWISEDVNHFTQLDQAYRKLTLWALKNNKSIKYTELCWELFKYSDENEILDHSHNSKFSGFEMIYILKLMSDSKWETQLQLNQKNKSLAIVLSELIGLKVSTLEKYIPKYIEHWDPIAKTDGIIKDRQNSLRKISNFLNEAGTATIITKMLSNMKEEKNHFGYFDEKK
jgi:hypothetical protein